MLVCKSGYLPMHKDTKMTCSLVAHLGRCRDLLQTESFPWLERLQILKFVRVICNSVYKQGRREYCKGGKRARSPYDSPAHLQSHKEMSSREMNTCSSGFQNYAAPYQAFCCKADTDETIITNLLAHQLSNIGYPGPPQ